MSAQSTWLPIPRGERYIDATGRIVGEVSESLVRVEWYATIRGLGSLGEYVDRASAKKAVETWIKQHPPAAPGDKK